ncbi:MAG: hypothetical protein JW803_05820 [Endomicrobiales bacterium]|nr:hypothetical protein [Endomicrobiales bacterium]
MGSIPTLRINFDILTATSSGAGLRIAEQIRRAAAFFVSHKISKFILKGIEADPNADSGGKAREAGGSEGGGFRRSAALAERGRKIPTLRINFDILTATSSGAGLYPPHGGISENTQKALARTSYGTERHVD